MPATGPGNGSLLSMTRMPWGLGVERTRFAMLQAQHYPSLLERMVQMASRRVPLIVGERLKARRLFAMISPLLPLFLLIVVLNGTAICLFARVLGLALGNKFFVRFETELSILKIHPRPLVPWTLIAHS